MQQSIERIIQIMKSKPNSLAIEAIETSYNVYE